MSDKQKLIEHILGDYGFTLSWEYTEHAARIRVYSIVGREGGPPGPPLYYIKNWEDSADNTAVLEEAQVLADVYIKFDGCTHIEFENNLHICGGPSLVEHILLMKHLYEKAKSLMGSSDQDMPELNIDITKDGKCLKT